MGNHFGFYIVLISLDIIPQPILGIVMRFGGGAYRPISQKNEGGECPPLQGF